MGRPKDEYSAPDQELIIGGTNGRIREEIGWDSGCYRERPCGNPDGDEEEELWA